MRSDRYKKEVLEANCVSMLVEMATFSHIPANFIHTPCFENLVRVIRSLVAANPKAVMKQLRDAVAVAMENCVEYTSFAESTALLHANFLDLQGRFHNPSLRNMMANVVEEGSEEMNWGRRCYQTLCTALIILSLFTETCTAYTTREQRISPKTLLESTNGLLEPLSRIRGHVLWDLLTLKDAAPNSMLSEGEITKRQKRRPDKWLQTERMKSILAEYTYVNSQDTSAALVVPKSSGGAANAKLWHWLLYHSIDISSRLL